MANAATVAAPAPTPCRARRPMAVESVDGQEEGEAGHPVGDQPGDQHRSAADPVGQPAERVLGEDAGGEERCHDHAGQGVGAAQVPDVDRQHGHDGAGPHPLEEDGQRQGADQAARPAVVGRSPGPGADGAVDGIEGHDGPRASWSRARPTAARRAAAGGARPNRSHIHSPSQARRRSVAGGGVEPVVLQSRLPALGGPLQRGQQFGLGGGGGDQGGAQAVLTVGPGGRSAPWWRRYRPG